MRRSFTVAWMIAVSLVVGMAATAAAQVPPPPSGITTMGLGSATIAPDSARVQFIVTDPEIYMGQPPVPAVEATPGAAARTKVTPIIEAIQGAESVSDVQVVVPVVSDPYSGSSSLARVEFDLDHPTDESLLNVLTSASQAASNESLMITAVGAMFIVSPDTCAALRDEARAAAFDDARQQAALYATDIGVGLGGITAVVDTNGWYGGPDRPRSSCDRSLQSTNFGGPDQSLTVGLFNQLTDTVEVRVDQGVQVTFAFDGQPAATPVS